MTHMPMMYVGYVKRHGAASTAVRQSAQCREHGRSRDEEGADQ